MALSKNKNDFWKQNLIPLQFCDTINMINNLLNKNQLASAALARIGQGYSPSRRQIIVRQKWWGMLNSVIKNSSLRSNF